MPSVLLDTKFLMPRLGAESLSRPHLLRRLTKAVNKRLTLISAPAGYGKTTLLAEMASKTTLPVAWYQLDEADNDPTIFISSLIGCLGRIYGKIAPTLAPLGQAAQALLDDGESSTGVSPEHVLTVLINELLERVTDTWLLVLEDYHLISNPLIHKLVNLLLLKGPPELHSLISTRVDPPLALAGLRARGKLAELRVTELRFSNDEVALLFARHIDPISEESVQILSQKTEGWAAALQIVLSSLAGRQENAERFIRQLSGTQRYIFDYLAEEVFQQHPQQKQQFLLQTAILSQMNAVVCNHILPTGNSQAMLERLEQDNLFVVSLDDEREWYRYHHLFRDFLLAKLRREQPEKVIELEKAAAVYYEAQGEMEAAFMHYLRSQDVQAAARALAVFSPAYVEQGRMEVLLRYLGDLPEEIVYSVPELLLQHGNILRRLGQADAAVSRYEEARVVFESHGDGAGVCRALTRLAEVAHSQGNYGRARDLSKDALTHASAKDHAKRARALMALAKSESFLTGMDRGRALAEEAVAAANKAGQSISPRIRANLLRSLGHICWWHGDPHATVRYCKQALRSIPDELSPAMADTLITITIPYIFWDELDTAQRYVEQGVEMAQRLQLAEQLPLGITTLGVISFYRRTLAQAERILRQAVALADESGLATHARILALGFLAIHLRKQGQLKEASELAKRALWRRGEGVLGTYERYFCRSVLADIMVAEGKLDEAQEEYESLIEIGKERQFRMLLAESYFGLAYIYLQKGRTEEGLQAATKSLAYLEANSLLQLHLDQTQQARVVYQALWDAGTRTPFVKKLLPNLPAQAVPKTKVDKQTIRVQCLGYFRVFVADEEITPEQWVSSKARDLLAYFITFRHDRILVDQAFEAIWPHRNTRSRSAYHSALTRLRQALRRKGESTKFVLVKAGEYWLDQSRFQIDVDEFEATLAQASNANPQEAAIAYEKAMDLYQGDYLKNLPYYDWAMPERRRVHQAYLTALQKLAHLKAAAGNYQQALDLTHRILQQDPLREEIHRQAMHYCAHLGHRQALIRQYQQLTAVLQEELNITPQPTTQKIYQSLLRGLRS